MVNNTPTWLEVKPPIPLTIAAHCIVAIDTSKLMIIGGNQNGANFQARTFILDITKCSWTEGPPLNAGRNFHSCARITVAVNPPVTGTIVVGGFNTPSTGEFRSEFLPDNNSTWLLGSPLPYPVVKAQLVNHPKGGLVLVGGATSSAPASNNLLYLKSFGSSWLTMDQTLKTPRSSHVALLIPDSEADCF